MQTVWPVHQAVFPDKWLSSRERPKLAVSPRPMVEQSPRTSEMDQRRNVKLTHYRRASGVALVRPGGDVAAMHPTVRQARPERAFTLP